MEARLHKIVISLGMLLMASKTQWPNTRHQLPTTHTIAPPLPATPLLVLCMSQQMQITELSCTLARLTAHLAQVKDIIDLNPGVLHESHQIASFRISQSHYRSQTRRSAVNLAKLPPPTSLTQVPLNP